MRRRHLRHRLCLDGASGVSGGASVDETRRTGASAGWGCFGGGCNCPVYWGTGGS